MLMSRAVASAAVLVGLAQIGTPPPPPDPGGDLWGSVSCAETPSAACDLGAGSGDGSSGVAPQQRPDVRRGDGPGRARAGQGGRGEATGPEVGVRCSYVLSDFRPPAGGVLTAAYVVMARTPLPQMRTAMVPAQQPAPGAGAGQAGAWYLWQCSGNGARDALYRPPVWIADGQRVPGGNGPSPAELADVARRQLRLPDPAISASPVGEQLVNLPTWLWLAGDWGAVRAMASVPGVTATAEAVPVSVAWDMGDGSSVVCHGPGTPYPPGDDPAAASPDCGHTYRVSSSGEPGGTFPVTATVTWTVTWTGTGPDGPQGGTFAGLTTTGAAAFPVGESQALVTGGR